MALITTPGRLLVEETLPEDMRESLPAMTAKASGRFFGELVEKHPGDYANILRDMTRAGAEAAEYQGREASIGMSDLTPPKAVLALRQKVRDKVDSITQDPRLTPEQRTERVVEYVRGMQDRITGTTVESAAREGNSMALAALHGFRGSPRQLTQILFGDLLVADHKGRPIAVPGLTGYGQGVTPMEYYAGSYGARQGAFSVQMGTAQGGYYSKLVDLASQRLKVTGKDCGAWGTGLVKKGDDPHILGYVLSRDTAGIPAGTPIEKKHLPKLSGQKVLVRALTECQQPEGVCQVCSGRREQGRFPAIGDHVGITASMDVNEPVKQKLALCLAEGTMVRMADGGEKAIEDIVPGDRVLGSDTEGDTFPVRVLNTYANGVRDCAVYTLVHDLVTSTGPAELSCTPDHRVLCSLPGEVIGVHRVEDAFVKGGCLYGESGYAYYPEFCTDTAAVDTYDIEVDHPDHLFVLANGLVVSNSAKHVGGSVGITDKRGIEELQQFTGIPQRFIGAAALSPSDGIVQKIEPAPQGGHYVTTRSGSSDIRTYVTEGRELLVSRGDTVEAGDMLSDGTPNPAEIVKYKGLGEGRRYAVEKLNQILADNGVPANSRNVEAMVAGWLNRVRITDPDGYRGWGYDALVPYNKVRSAWKPREDSEDTSPFTARGRFLEEPVLHYTIGTRITDSMAKNLRENGVSKVKVNREPPPFEPEAIRIMAVPSTDPDWKVRMTGYTLKKTLLDSATTGSLAEDKSTSPAAALMNPTML